MPAFIHRCLVLAAALLLLGALACNRLSTTPGTSPTPTVTAQPAAETQTATPLPTATATPTEPPAPTPTFTPTPPPATTATPTPGPTSTDVPSPTATPPPAAALDEIVSRVTLALPGLRGLDFHRDVPPQLITSEELADYLEREITQEDREDLFKVQQLLLVLGLIDLDTDLLQLYLDLLAEGVLGFFNLDGEELFIVSDAPQLGIVEELTVAHEYTHALQQQHFNIARLSDEAEHHRDRSSAVTALIEGDARFTELTYAFDRFTSAQLSRAFRDASSSSDVFDSAPAIIQRDLIFPYVEGSDFVRAVFNAGSWDGVDAAYSDPPVSTEQVLHPELYLEGHQPVDVAAPAHWALLNLGWQLVDENTVGEFFLRIFLDEEMSPFTASRAAAGWSGDRYLLFTDAGGRLALAFFSEWDTAADALEFDDAVRQYTGLALGPETAVQVARDALKVTLFIAADEENLAVLAGGLE